MGPTHNNQNSPGGPKKGGSVNITTPADRKTDSHTHRSTQADRQTQTHTQRHTDKLLISSSLYYVQFTPFIHLSRGRNSSVFGYDMISHVIF